MESGRRTVMVGLAWAKPTGRMTARRGGARRRVLRIWLFLLPRLSGGPRRCACYRLRLAGLWVLGGRFHREGSVRADYMHLPKAVTPNLPSDDRISNPRTARGAAKIQKNILSTRSWTCTTVLPYLWRSFATG